MDYQSNSRKAKNNEGVPKKNIEKVVASEVVVKKKPLGRKIKETFIEADLKTVITYVAVDVLLPAARNTIIDATTKGIERLMYGEKAIHRRNFGGIGPRITYNNPINREYREPITRPPSLIDARRPRKDNNDFILSTREEATLVLERMNDLIDTYEVASVADLHELVGFPSSHVDNKWGWSNLNNVDIRQIREGYLIDFPPAEPIS